MREDPRWQRYWRHLTGRPRREVDEEIAFHVEMRARELEARGLDPATARQEAERRFGDRARIQATLNRIEQKRGRRMGLSFLAQELTHDLRYGARSLLKRPGYALMTAGSLALGIGAATVVLSLIDSFLLRPLPVRDPGELVVIGASNRATGSLAAGVLGLPTVHDLEARTDLFQGVAATAMTVAATRTADGDPGDRSILLAVTGNYFPLLGVSPSLGRVLGPVDERERAPVVVLGHRTWVTRFGGDPGVIGRTIHLNTLPFVVVGVAPPEFTGTEHLFDPAGYVPTALLGLLDPAAGDLGTRRDAGRFTAIARRQPGRTVAEIGSGLEALSREIERLYPVVGEQFRLRVFPESRARPNMATAGGMAAASVVAATLALLVLLTAAVNATNLILARGTTRVTELAVRQALGASRRRLASQLLTETLLLAALALAGGWLLARLGVRLLTSIPLAVDDLALRWGLALDLRVFGMAVAVTLLIGLVAGLAPALSVVGRAVQPHLREGGRAGAGRRGRLSRSALVVAQVAASLVVLVCAGLFLTSARQAGRVQLGFRADHLLTFGMNAEFARYDEGTARRAFERIREAVERVPGVREAAWATTVPIKRGALGMSEVIGDADARVGMFAGAVGPGYFEVMGIPLIEGRGFLRSDDSAAAQVVVINRKAAEALFPGGSAVGRRVRLDPAGPPLEVVGVAEDGRYLVIFEAPRPYLYRPLAQSYSPAVYLHIRTEVDPATLIAPVRAAVAAADRDLVPFSIAPMEEALATSPNGTLLFKMGAGFALAVGLLGLALTLAGLYGVTAFSVAQRTREIGIRIALGASRRAVIRSILREGGKLAAAGIVLGAVVAVLIARLLGGLLLGSRSADAAIFAVVAVGLALATLLSAYVPARRAARIDPVRTLNQS